MEAKTKKSKGFVGIKSGGLVMLICIVIAILFFKFVCGDPSRFMEGNSDNHPLNGDTFATIYKGGSIIAILMGLLLSVLVLSVERFFAIRTAHGTGNLVKFVASIKGFLAKNDLKSAMALCDKQGGSIGNVVMSSLQTYQLVYEDSSMTKEQKMVAISKSLEESTALELPMLQENLPIIGTMTTLGTLIGLLGTVLGMIKSFSALATAGAPDSLALSTGISEALMNTAFGIATGAVAVVSYNFFTNKIDRITYSIDEVGFSIVQTFAANHK